MDAGKQLTGREAFFSDGLKREACVSDFWRWAFSEINDNTTRAVLGEYIVAMALGEKCATAVRSAWPMFDLETTSGCRIEVKTTARRQSWRQKKPSVLQFDIAKKKDWEIKATEERRHADLYVFCVFDNEDEQISPLDLSRWTFYVVATKEINERFDNQKSVRLSKLVGKAAHIKADFDSLSSAINRTMEGGIPMEKKLLVEGMMCKHCKATVEKVLSAVPGVTAVVVDLEAKSAAVCCNAGVLDADLCAAVEKKGFKAQMA